MLMELVGFLRMAKELKGFSKSPGELLIGDGTGCSYDIARLAPSLPLYLRDMRVG